MFNKSYGVAKNGVTMKIELTQKEAQICNALKEVSVLIAKERPELPLIESRIAGGWVRDKLLGKESHDLDIAINDMMGYEFATYVNKYLSSQGIPTRSIAKIDSNPEHSKHLETATTKVFGQEVDFCNLRTEIREDETEQINTPFGTPSGDAHHRDITINSMFYNVNSGSVEDFTGKGIADLINGLIRTPLTPLETFRDDPLRVLRCIRFAGRFKFEMVPELCEAAQNKDIQDALKNKITRERIGIEFEKMITGPYPLISLRWIHTLNLYFIVMSPPTTITSGTVGEPSLAMNAASVVEWLCCNNSLEYKNLIISSDAEKRALLFSASTLPYINVESELKKKKVPAVQMVMKDSVKTSNLDANTVSTIFRGITLLKELADKNLKEKVKRSELGMVIRDLGALWQTSVKMSVIKEILDSSPNLTWSDSKSLDSNISRPLCEKYEKLINTAKEYGIDECYTWKNMVDGKRAAQVVGIKPGPAVTELLKVQMAWQLENPQGTKEECEKALLEFWQSK